MSGFSESVDFQIIENIRVLFSITKQLPPISSLYLLQMIQAEGPVSQNTLAELLRMKPQSVSEHLKKMEARGLIVRTPNEKDWRVQLISITETGEKELEGAEDRMKSYADAFLEGFADEEKEVLNTLLKKMVDTNEGRKTKVTPARRDKPVQEEPEPNVPEAPLGLDAAKNMVCTCKGRRCIVSWDENGTVEGYSCRIGLESAAEMMQRDK